MKSSRRCRSAEVSVFLIVFFALLGVGAAHAETAAVSAIITGGQIQKVGYRAKIQKVAIQYNLAGSTENGMDGGTPIVKFKLQGDRARIDEAVTEISLGTKKSVPPIKVVRASAAVDPGLKTFTIVGWTSNSRNITTPYNLVFTVRTPDKVISWKKAKSAWNDIALRTLKGADLAKFRAKLDDDE